MPFNEFIAVKAIKLLLRDCFDISSELCKPLEMENFLVMKSGYVKEKFFERSLYQFLVEKSEFTNSFLANLFE